MVTKKVVTVMITAAQMNKELWTTYVTRVAPGECRSFLKDYPIETFKRFVDGIGNDRWSIAFYDDNSVYMYKSYNIMCGVRQNFP